MIVYNNQKEEHRFVQPFVVIGRVGKPFVSSAILWNAITSQVMQQRNKTLQELQWVRNADSHRAISRIELLWIVPTSTDTFVEQTFDGNTLKI